MPIVLPYDRLSAQLPQPSIMVAARSDKICAISTESTVPHPTLMALQACLQWKSPRCAFCGKIFVAFNIVRRGRVDRPDAGVMIGAAGGKMTDIGGKKNPSDVCCMCLKGGYGYE